MKKSLFLGICAVLLFTLALQTTNNAEGQVVSTTPSYITIDLSGTPNVNDFPYGITCDDPSYCWLTITGQGKLARVDKNTQAVTLFDNDPLSASGREWYSSVYHPTSGDIFVNERDNGLVLRYDPELNSWTGIPIVPNLDSPDNPNISYPSGFTTEPSIIRLQETTHGLHTYDLSTGSFGEMKLANGYIWVVLNYSWDFDAEGNAVLADQTFNGIVRINPADNSIVQYPIVGSSALRGITIDSSDPTILWISDNSADKVFKFDTTSNSVTQTINLPAGSKARGITNDLLNLYVAENKVGGLGETSKIQSVTKLGVLTGEIDTTALNTGSGTFSVFIANNILVWTDESSHLGTVNLLNPLIKTVSDTTGNTSTNHFGALVGNSIWFAGHGSAKIPIISFTTTSADPTRGGSCTGDCMPPTLGLLSNGQRVVDRPISYVNSFSNFTALGQYFHTPMENLESRIGDMNNLTFTVFENSGTDFLWKVGIGAGCPIDGSYSDCSAIVEWLRSDWGKTDDGKPIISVKDPENLLSGLIITVTPDSCSVGSNDKNCNRISLIHTWRESPKDTMMIIDITDHKRNNIQQRLNHGVNVLGNSMNPPDKHIVFDSIGYTFVITELDDYTAIDELGNKWFLNNNGFWIRELKMPDMAGSLSYFSGYDRNDVKEFNMMEHGQELIAKGVWDSDLIQAYPDKIIENIPTHYGRTHNSVDNMVQARISYESSKYTVR